MQTDRTPADGVPLDARGRKRGKATMPGYGTGRPPKSKGKKYPPQPYDVTDVFLLLNACEPTPGRRLRWDEQMAAIRLRALIALLWRSGLRISEALALDDEVDMNRSDRTVTVRHGKGDKRRVIGMDDWGWRELDPWIAQRRFLKPGALFCVLSGLTEGNAVHDSDIRRALHATAARAGLRRRCHPHAFRHTLAVDLYREGKPELVIQAQLGHARLDVTARYLRSLDPRELIEPVSGRPAPVMPVPNADPRQAVAAAPDLMGEFSRAQDRGGRNRRASRGRREVAGLVPASAPLTSTAAQSSTSGGDQ